MGIISYNEYSKIMSCILTIIKCCDNLVSLAEDCEPVPDKLMVEIMRLNNVSVDFVEAYKTYIKEEK